AVAGLLITVINIVGGIIIGVAQNDLTLSQASKSYTLLTVGDGLVTQIPAIIVSTAAGFLVSKGGTSGSTEKALLAQLSGYPKGLGVPAVLLAALALVPGIPMAPFATLAAGAGALAWQLSRRRRMAEAAQAQADQAAVTAVPLEEPIATALAIDHLRLELG